MRNAALASTLLALLAPACAEGPDDAELDTLRLGSNRLKDNASVHVPVIGAAVSQWALDENKYRNRLRHHFNQATVGNALKWHALRQDPNAFDFTGADMIVDLAESNGQSVRGHTLVWEVGLPAWMNDGLGSIGVRDAMLDHIETVVGRYEGRIAHWDVVNEVLDAGGNYRDNLFHRAMGPQYVQLAFEEAHAADPQASLAYNDFDLEKPGPKQDGAVAMVEGLLAAGVPIHEVGIQMHTHPYDWVGERISVDDLRGAIARFGALGVDVYITELDVRIDELSGSTSEIRRVQRRVYQNVAAACHAEPACAGVTTWGFTDKHTYLPPEAAPLPFDDAYRGKPAKAGLRDGLAGAGPITVNRPWDTACPIAGATFCEPLESPTFYGLGRVHVGGGTTTLSSDAWRGGFSVHTHAPTASGTRRAYVERRFASDIREGEVWTRAYVNVSGDAPNHFTVFAVDEIHAPHNGVSFGVHTDGRMFVRTGGASPYRAYGPSFPRDGWTCVEMRVDVGTSGGAELFLEGASVAQISGRNTRFGSGYGRVKGGIIWAPGGGAPIDVRVDEFAVGRTRLGCD